MRNILRSEDRGKADHGWLKSYHTFSFAEYYNPERIRFKTLRVINEDFVAPGEGFPTHPHDNMEIISYVVSGQIAHKDSMGNVKIVKAGEVQAMTAGRGVTHSEFNPSDTEPLHLLQIWIFPERKGLTPSYSEWKPTGPLGKLTTIASHDGDNGSVIINQDAKVMLGNLAAGEILDFKISANHALWLQLFEGSLTSADASLEAGDALSIESELEASFATKGGAKFILFEL